MANAIGIRAVRRPALNWAMGEDGMWSNVDVARRFVASQQPNVELDGGRLNHAQSAPSLQVGGSSSPWAWNHSGVRSFHTRNLSQLVASRGSKRLCLVDTLALVNPVVAFSSIRCSGFVFRRSWCLILIRVS